ncbi:hypothetical protein LUZ62_048512 [Rhynchospora pubera]|uniref:Uncharacterized protein n=1 Tax=Rhynchospora pubera TaxID=906938 RepID=A0AAV8G1H4_9POAL|nr:hypothetical protein LUZ62_048512 [Rhynchospora pubera]
MKNPTTEPDVNPADHNLLDFTFAWLPLVGLTFLLFNSCIALYHSGDDAWYSIASIIVSLTNLVFLAFILRVFQWPLRDSSLRRKVNAAVWFLATLLTIMFSYPNSAAVPPAIAITAWSMAIAAIVGIYYAFFIYKESDGHQIVSTKDENNSP